MEVRTFAGVERSFLSIGNIFRIEYVCQCITNVINKHHSNKKRAKREKINYNDLIFVAVSIWPRSFIRTSGINFCMLQARMGPVCVH